MPSSGSRRPSSTARRIPHFEYRLLKGGQDEIASNYAAALSSAPVVQTGSLFVSAKGHETVVAKQELLLLPGHRYLVSFAFKTPPLNGWIDFLGPFLRRSYTLPAAGAPLGFGMHEGERRALPLSTDSDKPEHVELTIGVVDGGPFAGRRADVADFTVQDVAMDTLPVRQAGYLPLRLEVNAPQPGCTVETPQRYVTGYSATVDGRPAPVLMSPWRNIMVGVPPGRSVVEITYPGLPLARASFKVSAWCWAGFLVCLAVSGSQVPDGAARSVAAGIGACRLRLRLAPQVPPPRRRRRRNGCFPRFQEERREARLSRRSRAS